MAIVDSHNVSYRNTYFSLFACLTCIASWLSNVPRLSVRHAGAWFYAGNRVEKQMARRRHQHFHEAAAAEQLHIRTWQTTTTTTTHPLIMTVIIAIMIPLLPHQWWKITKLNAQMIPLIFSIKQFLLHLSFFTPSHSYSPWELSRYVAVIAPNCQSLLAVLPSYFHLYVFVTEGVHCLRLTDHNDVAILHISLR